MLRMLGLPAAASAHANEMDGLMGLTHWLMAGMFVVWAAFFLVVLLRFRSGRRTTADYHGTRGLASTLAGCAVVVEAVLIIAHAFPVWTARAETPPSEAVVVRVVGEQFAWNIHYPGADGLFGRTTLSLIDPDNPLGLDRRDPAAVDDITTVNQLVLPVGRAVVIRLSSKDVIHSFAIPEMRVKHDAVPGIDSPVWFTPTSIGEYEVVCSQLCGLAHYRMRAAVSIKSATDFQAFLAEEASRPR